MLAVVSSCVELNDRIKQALQPPNSGYDSADDGTPCAPEQLHAGLSHALTVPWLSYLWSYSEHTLLAEIQTDLVACKQKCAATH